ncbi:phosphoglucomutase/phosphomannomutase family protein [bacterium]|nr:phosphoglucomutase/phosphomannomutase family protein [bacterium]
MTKIKFGTAGWRAILSDEFTFDNVKRVLNAIILYVRQEGINRPVVVGSDTRFLAKQFREMTAEHLANNGIDVLLTNRDCPTPVISFVIRNEKLAGGINFTASHNPPEYQGIKFSPADGALAGTETTRTIEAMIDQPVEQSSKKGVITEINPIEDYLAKVSEFFDFDTIRNANLKIAYDALYGTGRGYLDEILKRAGVDVTVIHNNLNPLFGGRRPEPSPENLEELISLVKNNDFNLGLSTDGDADRFGVIDSDGTFFEANKVLCLVAWHQFRNKKRTGRIVRNVATTTFLDRIADYFDVELVEVPVGFKNIGPFIIEGNVLVGGEESAGLTIGGHVPDKDGILAGMLIAELIATENKTLKEIWSDIEQAVGTGWNDRVDLELNNEKKAEILDKLEKQSKETFLDRKVLKFNGIDGYKFTFSPAEWVLVRPSGTEPIIRCYMESDTPENGAKLKADLMEFVNN